VLVLLHFQHAVPRLHLRLALGNRLLLMFDLYVRLHVRLLAERL
jgi:hypothetical protein